MSTFTLSGSGTHALTANTTGLQVTITTPSAFGGVGRSNPVAKYDQGLIRFSDGTSYWPPVAILGGPQFIPVPANATSIGYALLGGAAVSVVEVIGGTLFFSAGTQSVETLSDVQVASVANGQLLAWNASAGKWENVSPSTPGVGALSLISSQTLSGTAASVTFSSIPNTYTHLKFVMLVRGDTAAQDVQMAVRFNADSGGSQYNDAWGYGGAGGASGAAIDAAASIFLGQIPAASAPAGAASPVTIDIPFYTQTTFHKSLLARLFEYRAANNEFSWHAGGTWKSTAAITSVTILPSAGNFVSGCLFALYGVS